MIKNVHLLLFSVLLWLAACTNTIPTPELTQVSVVGVVIKTVVSITPTPSRALQPTAQPTTMVAPTITAVPTQTPIPLPLAPMTPFPTITPNYSYPEPKSIFLFYGNSGGDGGGAYRPSLVIYTDGQAVLLDEENGSRTYLQTYVTPSEMCDLRHEVEATGFLDSPTLGEYYTQREQSAGATNIVIQLENTFYSFYAPDIQYLIDDLKPGYNKIANYQPIEPYEPFLPTYLSLNVIESTPDPEKETILEVWPPEFPPLKEPVMLIEGDSVVPVFNLFTNQLHGRFFQDGEKIYLVFPNPLLPHETPQNHSDYPARPYDYVSLLDCEDEASFVSSEIPTATPTLAFPASKLTGKGRVLFVTESDGDREIYVMEADGTNRIRLTNNLFDDWSPSWSPDGQSIVFVSDRDGDREIFTMAIDGTTVMQLTDNEVSDAAPSWSPDSSQLAFVSDRDGGWKRSEIYLMNSDGTQQQRLTNNDNRDLAPRWSVDDRYIIFIQEVIFNEKYQTVIVDTDQASTLGSNEQVLHQYDQIPVWSPDQSMLATTNELENNGWEINLMNADMLVMEQFSVQVHYPFSLDWTNDGKFIVFSGYSLNDYGHNRNPNIFALDVSTGELIQLTYTESGEFSPDLWP